MRAVSVSNVNASPVTRAAMLAQQNKDAWQRINSLENRLRTAESENEKLRAERDDALLRLRLNGAYSFAYIDRWVCQALGVSSIKSTDMSKRHVFARNAFCYWAKELTPGTFTDIGRYCNKHHTTVTKCYRRYKVHKRVDKAAIRGLL